MKQATLKLKIYASYVNIVDNNNLQKRVLYFMLCSLGTLALFYVFLLGNMVFNIIERRGLETNAHTLSNEVGNLELVYLSLSNKVDLNLATVMGFKETPVKYAIRKSIGFSSLDSVKIAKNDL